MDRFAKACHQRQRGVSQYLIGEDVLMSEVDAERWRRLYSQLRDIEPSAIQRSMEMPTSAEAKQAETRLWSTRSMDQR